MFSIRSTILRAANTRLYSETGSSAKETVKQAAGAFKKDGAVGKEFQPEGSVGSTAHAVGGPFDKDGAVGKQFTDKGAVGGTGQKVAEESEKAAEQSKKPGE